MNTVHDTALLRSGWKAEEDSLLFEMAGQARGEGKPLKTVFEQVAAATGRRPNSIRNYYYARLREDDGRIRAIGQSAAFVPFTNDEIEHLLRTVLAEQAKGVSVRACTLAMGNGDNKLMLRYQNKYRSLIKSNPKLVRQIISGMQNEGIAAFDPYSAQRRARKAGRPPKSNEGLVEAISGVVNDLSKVDGLDVASFFESLGALAAGAAKNAETVRPPEESADDATDVLRLQTQNSELKETLSRKNTELEAQKERFSALIGLFRRLIGVNKDFLGMTGVAKISSLDSYIQKLAHHMERCEKLLFEYAD